MNPFHVELKGIKKIVLFDQAKRASKSRKWENATQFFKVIWTYFLSNSVSLELH